MYSSSGKSEFLLTQDDQEVIEKTPNRTSDGDKRCLIAMVTLLFFIVCFEHVRYTYFKS